MRTNKKTYAGTINFFKFFHKSVVSWWFAVPKSAGRSLEIARWEEGFNKQKGKLINRLTEDKSSLQTMDRKRKTVTICISPIEV